jgi:hypothetical protein
VDIDFCWIGGVEIEVVGVFVVTACEEACCC